MWGTTVTAATSAPPATVWPLLADPGRWPEWDPALESARGAVAKGARVHTRLRSGRGVTLRVVSVDPGRAVADRQRLPMARLTVTRTIAADAGGSRLTFDARFSGVLGRLWWRIAGGRLATGLQAQSRGLVAAAERPAELQGEAAGSDPF